MLRPNRLSVANKIEPIPKNPDADRDYSLVEVQPVEDLLGHLEHLVDVLELVWVAVEGEVYQRHLEGDDVLRRHVGAVLRAARQFV